jgi:hypothetical protein
MSYALKIQKTRIVREAGDSAIEVQAVLADSLGVPFQTTSGAIDSFSIRAPKSSIPISGHLAYLEDLATKAIAQKYEFDISLYTAAPVGDTLKTTTSGDVQKLFKDLGLTGPGLLSPASITSILSDIEIKLSTNLSLSVTGTTTSPSVAKTGTVTNGSNHITAMSSTTGLSLGMVVSGAGISSGAAVASIVSSTEIVISISAVGSAVGTSLSFETDANSIYLSAVSPAIFLSKGFNKMTVTGTGIPDSTTVGDVISTSKV